MPDETPVDNTVRTITIAGHEFTVSTPFAEGHTCTEAEAKALNQTRCEAIRNNKAKSVKAVTDEEGAITKGDMKKLTAEVAEYDAAYVFTLSNAGGTRSTMDPVEKEARAIARQLISAALKDAGRKISEVDKEALANAIATKAAQDDTMAMARERVEARKANTANALDGLGI